MCVWGGGGCAQLLYNIGLVSVMHWQESATGIHMSPPSWTPSYFLHHPTPLGCHRAVGWVPCAALFTVARTWKQPRWSLTNEWIQTLWYIYILEYYSAIKRWCIWVRPNEVDEPRACYTEWNKSERQRQILYINTCIWNLERWYWWTYLQGSNDTAFKDWNQNKSEGKKLVSEK